VKLTIAICTYNRAAELTVCLRALQELGYPARHDVLVVDNSDDPAQLTANEELASELKGARYLRSAPPGLSRARNVALAEAEGDVVAFLDDDAACQDGWAEAVLEAFEDGGVVCAGGPILPRWDSPAPAWLDGELLQALAVMDLGTRARDLDAAESLYGANIAFRRPALQGIGGFAVDLGRSKADLLGDEEIDVQRKLRSLGRIRWAPRARVLHSIRSDRCSLDWFLRRYAWQGVTDARSGDPGTLAYLGTLLVGSKEAAAAQRLLRELYAPAPRSMEEVTVRVHLARALVAALLDNRVPAPGRTASGSEKPRSVADPELETFRLQVPGDTEFLFVEFGISHSYLFGVYGAIPGSCFLNPRLDPSAQREECLQFLQDALFYASRTGIRAVVLLTADILTWGSWDEALLHRSANVRLLGFLHRTPPDAEAGRRLAKASRCMDGLFVFADPLRRFLGDQCHVTSVKTVPHPPIFFANAAPRRPRRSGAERLTLSLLGEVRPGKGYEAAVEALASAPLGLRSRVKLLMAGAVEDETRSRIADACARAGLCAELHLRARAPGSYRIVPDSLFAKAIADTDVMVYPFEPDHWHVFSGHFTDALFAGCRFIASRGSVLGELVERHQLGQTFESGRRDAFLEAVESMLDRLDAGAEVSAERFALLDQLGVAAACRAVEAALRGDRESVSEPSIQPELRPWREQLPPEATVPAARG
jgi:GT2 family glycosyltransferase/glycosyltransferase involved in cell wall biosynthesis